MRGKAKVIIVGNVGQQPETRYAPSGDAITTVHMAVNEEWKDKQTGEKKQSTDWHKVVFFGKLAEIIAQHVQQGQSLYVEGVLKNQKWEDKETGKPRTSTYIKALEFQFIGSGAGKEPRQEQPEPVEEVENFDDDIPF